MWPSACVSTAEVDFVVNENSATDVFCLTKSGNAKMGKTIEIVEKPIQNKSYSDIKKIDFEKLENEINNPDFRIFFKQTP